MAEADQDALLAVLLLLGAAFQYATGGPWLLLIGALGVGLRIGFARDERRGLVVTAGACLLWFVLHLIVTRGMTRFAVAAEVGAFSGMVILFWVARQMDRERIAAEVLRLDDAGGRADEQAARLRRLRADTEALVRESEDLDRLFSVSKSIGEVLREEDVVEVIREAAQGALRMPSFILLGRQDEALRVRAQRGLDGALAAAASLPAGEGTLAGWCFARREPVLVDDVSADPRFGTSPVPFRALAVLPMVVRDEPVGSLLAFDARPRQFTRQDYTRAGILARQLALGVGKMLLYSRIEELSITDGLTKLYRHRYFQDRLEVELERARRYHRPLSLVMGDLDHFKRFNDTWGHLEGDAVLRHASGVLESRFRRPAILARYGGEEFAILLPDTEPAAAHAQAEAFRTDLEATALPGRPGRPPVTMSLGVAGFPDDAQTRRDLIARADAALYASKHAGKNRVTRWTAGAGEGAGRGG
jgi:diguanylate cyclase (GGDEF)-like protein